MKTPIVEIDEDLILEMHSIICEELTFMLLEVNKTEKSNDCACLKCLSGRAMTKTMEFLKEKQIVEVRLKMSSNFNRRQIN